MHSRFPLRWRFALLSAVVGLELPSAFAQALPEITDRNFSLDAYDGVALGTVRIIGMGGAAVATAEGSAGTQLNPASPAVRSATSNDWWDLDFHLDAVTTTTTTDRDNSGFTGADGSTTATTGISGIAGPWGLALVANGLTASSGVGSNRIDTELFRAKFALARTFGNEAYTFGLAVRAGLLKVDSSTGQPLLRIGGQNLEFGGLWRPYQKDLRVGASVALPISGTNVDATGCDPMDCAGHILPSRVVVPWHTALGVAYRVAPSQWNQHVTASFRDERSLLVATDLVITGAVIHGAGLEAFARGLLQRSGTSVSISPRLGTELELFPGRLRLRAGAYWEPARLEDTRGRIHGTAGVEVRWLQFDLFGPRRLRLSLTVDSARHYLNGGLSIGFWH